MYIYRLVRPAYFRGETLPKETAVDGTAVVPDTAA
jgi:hypothetical protein